MRVLRVLEITVAESHALCQPRTTHLGSFDEADFKLARSNGVDRTTLLQFLKILAIIKPRAIKSMEIFVWTKIDRLL
jgi:hypothetical protein